jgi:hypothetical protein
MILEKQILQLQENKNILYRFTKLEERIFTKKLKL